MFKKINQTKTNQTNLNQNQALEQTELVAEKILLGE